MSVEYAPKEGYQWYVLRATYGREIKALEAIRSLGGVAYVPLHRTREERDGKLKKVLKPFVQQFVFLYSNKEGAYKFVNEVPELNYLTFYYNHFDVANTGYNPPLTIPFNKMSNFIRLTSLEDEHVEVITNKHVVFKNDEMVRITDGKFKGIVGKVARIDRNNRVVVTIENVCMIATAFVPKYALEKIPD
ncbi:transcriptional regulator [Prevotella lacticifex]|uniref:Transcriptional regulator n=1 Tax=Prevotella lacticifex TaxID=2854755 RepID=A0A9R1C7K7_9BACT|nr:UpxY family transcription antiterminator [Prevotella lacticifex]GJG37236.1 transcriptional regulator [Prevotella lacticifex]GJG40264.1 transcriptional regulator [Prevotella lacticifex]GJG43958.1 transcriptional regulator [Prevotella lacticifex]GJG46642.1 transcriptional regulator [Prevotella lacticifex]GJG50738.1 transcriptional regulator [Prevotella lacticifex]